MARCHQSRGLIHKSSAGWDRAWGGAGDGAGNRGGFVVTEPAWRACVCGGSWGKRIGGFVVESSQSAAPCMAHGRAQPTHGSQQHPEPLPARPTPAWGQHTPTIPLPHPPLEQAWEKGSQQGKRAGKPPHTSAQDKPRSLKAPLATCLHGGTPLDLSLPICKMEGGDAGLLEVLQRVKS